MKEGIERNSEQSFNDAESLAAEATPYVRLVDSPWGS